MRPVALLLLIPVVALAGALRPGVQPITSHGGGGTLSAAVLHSVSGDILTLERRNVMTSIEIQGIVVPVGGEVLGTPAAENNAGFVLAKILPHGSPVNAGDRIGHLEAKPWVQQREAAERGLEQAERTLHAGRERAALAQRARKTAQELSQEDLEHKRASLKAYVEVAVDLRLRAEKLTEQRLQAMVDDQRDELAQLEAMYSQDELVDAVEQIVLRRARRGLATAISQLQLNKDQRAHAENLEHPRQLRLLEREVSAAQLALDTLKLEQGLQQIEQAARLSDAARMLAEARETLDRSRAVESGLVLVSSTSGVLLHGGAREWKRGTSRPDHHAGDRLPADRGAFLVFPADRVRVALLLTEQQVGPAREASVVRALPATGQAAREGTLVVDAYPDGDGKFVALLEFTDPWVGVLPGIHAQVVLERVVLEDAILLPQEAMHWDGGQAWCLLVRARAGGGEEFVRREVSLGTTHGEGVEVLSGLEAGDRVLMGDAP